MTTAAPSNTRKIDLEEINSRVLANASPQEVIQWAAQTFGHGLVMTSSFGAESAVMLHLVTRVLPDIPVITIDTGYFFPETYTFMEALTERFKLNLKVYQSPISPARMEATMGRLWENGKEGLDAYDKLRKVEPLQRALRELNVTAWLSGVRADQTDFRKTLRTVEANERGQHKVHPILSWTTRQTHEYMKKHGLPYHPLYDQGYASIGDHHSTSPTVAGQDPRSGRFMGMKQECGIHLPGSTAENDSRGSADV